MSKKLKVVFITQDEPYYIPKYIYDTFIKLGEEVEVLKVYALPPNLSNKNFLQTVQYYLSYYGVVVFSYMVFLKIYYIIYDLTNFIRVSDSYHSVRRVCRKFNIAYASTDRINSNDVLSELTKLKPDVIFSIACPQIFGKKIISIPLKGCLNIHSSLLPKYRGLNANFWVLAKGEKSSGVTIHYINPGIDDGDILLQEKIRIEDKWSLNDLYTKAIEVGSGMITKCLKSIYEDRVITNRNDISNGSYFSYPNRNDVKEFKSRGRKFFRYF